MLTHLVNQVHRISPPKEIIKSDDAANGEIRSWWNRLEYGISHGVSMYIWFYACMYLWLCCQPYFFLVLLNKWRLKT